MYCHIGCLGSAKSLDEFVGYPGRIGNRHAGMPAHDLHVVQHRQSLVQIGYAPWRQHEGIAARHDHFPDLRMRADVLERQLQCLRR